MELDWIALKERSAGNYWVDCWAVMAWFVIQILARASFVLPIHLCTIVSLWDGSDIWNRVVIDKLLLCCLLCIIYHLWPENGWCRRASLHRKSCFRGSLLLVIVWFHEVINRWAVFVNACHSFSFSSYARFLQLCLFYSPLSLSVVNLPLCWWYNRLHLRFATRKLIESSIKVSDCGLDLCQSFLGHYLLSNTLWIFLLQALDLVHQFVYHLNFFFK